MWCVTKILITGMSGAGKTTLLAEIATRGVRTVDTDYGGYVTYERLWDEEKIGALLAACGDPVLSGTVSNQGLFYSQFDHIVLLSAPLEVLLQRVRERADNPYEKTPEQRAEIANYVAEVEPLLRGGASLELDGTRPVKELGDTIMDLLV